MTMCDNERTPSIIEGGAVAKNDKVKGRPKPFVYCLKNLSFLFPGWFFPKSPFGKKAVAASPGALPEGLADGRTDRHIKDRVCGAVATAIFKFLGSEVSFFQRIPE